MSTVPGPKVLLLGDSGAGKTYSIVSLINAGYEVFAVFTEPGMEVVAHLPSDKLHWHYIPPSAPDWDSMIDSANKINKLTFQSLASLGDVNKQKYTEFIQLLSVLANFKDQRTGKEYGPIDNLDPAKQALFIDSLSGISIMAINLVTGSKPVKSQSDWGVAMDNLERLLIRLTTGIPATMVLTAHVERETDEVSGGVILTASTLGRKLAPKIPRFFSDIILCQRQGTKFTWSTAAHGVAVKARNLPIADNLPPDFGVLLSNWKQRTEMQSSNTAL